LRTRLPENLRTRLLEN